MALGQRDRRNLLTGLAFLGPNVLGFLAFTLIPLILSMALAFTNWDLRRHNMFKNEPIQFVGLEHFYRLFSEPEFLRFLGNTLFFMMGIPFGIAGSLILALLLSRDMHGKNPRTRWYLLAAAGLGVGCGLLAAVGAGASAMALLLIGIGGVVLLGGIAGGSTVYRTLFFLPSFTSGAAVYILWKKLYSDTGPINTALRPPLQSLTLAVRGCPTWVFTLGTILLAALLAGCAIFGLRRLQRRWAESDLGTAAALPSVFFLILPVILAVRWMDAAWLAWGIAIVVAVIAVWLLAISRKGQELPCSNGEGFGMAAMGSLGLMVLEFVLLGLAIVVWRLPFYASPADNGLDAPGWLADVHWAKPAIMIMGLWIGIGSNNMLLYLAGLSNVPPELYEAADIDGAKRGQRFWNVTWPQLAPTTFFIVIMSVIGGLQGGFEMARVMTNGGPAGATTTLSFFIYQEGFRTGRLGFSAAVAWALFAMILVATLINWRFGNRYVND